MTFLRILSFAGLAAALSGCLGKPPVEATCWSIEDDPDPALRVRTKPLADAVRLSSVTVRAPYAGTRLAVLRPDGSVAFDGFNAFAALPALMLRGAAVDAIEAQGSFGRVISASSQASTPYSLELSVSRLALDCRREGRRDACVAVRMTLVKDHRIVWVGWGEGSEQTGDGNYTRAFSRAFAKALQAACQKPMAPSRE